jgi:hypothetical protein
LPLRSVSVNGAATAPGGIRSGAGSGDASLATGTIVAEGRPAPLLSTFPQPREASRRISDEAVAETNALAFEYGEPGSAKARRALGLSVAKASAKETFAGPAVRPRSALLIENPF